MRINAFTSLLLFIFQNVCCQSGTGSDDGWVDPNAWAQSSDDFKMFDADTCSRCTHLQQAPPNDQINESALIYFKKFIKSLFHRKHLQFNKDENLYQRAVVISLLQSQLDELENADDVRDLDIVLTNILENLRSTPLHSNCKSHTSYSTTGVFALIKEILRDTFQLLKISEVQFAITVLLTIAIGWFVRKRYRYHVLLIILSGFAIYGYFFTYLECNRKLELEQMLEVLESTPSNDKSQQSWFGRLINYFSPEDKEQQRRQLLKKSTRINLLYCRPDHVLIIYLNELFIKQLQMLLENVSHTINKLRSGLPFPYNIIAPIALVILVGYIVKLTFKYILSPRAWAALMHNRQPNNNNSDGSPQQASSITNDTSGDRISGENLKLLLNVMHSATTVTSTLQLPPGSGVQEILEALEAPKRESDRKSDQSDQSDQKSNTSANSSSDSPSISTSIVEEEFTLVDDNSEVEIIDEDDDNADEAINLSLKVSL